MSDAVLSQFKQEEAKEEIKAERKIKVGIIGTGGMMTPKDIRRMFEAGASLVALNSGIRENGFKLLREAVKELETAQ